MSDLSNCRRCGTLIVGRGLAGLCPACERVSYEEVGADAGNFVRQYGLAAFFKLVLWVASLMFSLVSLTGLLNPGITFVAVTLFFGIPLWAFFKKFGTGPALGLAFLSICAIVVVDDEFNSGLLLRSIWSLLG